jgi:uncharacterized protein YcbK (DUF882 family)
MGHDNSKLIGGNSPSKPTITTDTTRRRLLFGGAAAASSLVLPARVKAGIGGAICVPGTGGGGYDAGGGGALDDGFRREAPLMDDHPTRSVLIYHNHTRETFNETYCVDGKYVPEALEKFNNFARDHHNGAVRNMDPGLLDIIFKLTYMLNVSSPWGLSSGYRSRATNEKLRRQGYGAAKNSYHIRGRAHDLTNRDRPPSAVYSTAMKIGLGGVGKYNSFTHVDTGPIRTWG